MNHNHFEHCLQGWPTLLVLLAVASLGTAGFIGLLGGVGRLLAIRGQSVPTPAPPVRAMPASGLQVATGAVLAGAGEGDGVWRRPAGRAHGVTASGPMPAVWWSRSVPPVRGRKLAEGVWPGVRRRRTSRAALTRRRVLPP
jgi:hypothetical protein